jgi:hypothetical protein
MNRQSFVHFTLLTGALLWAGLAAAQTRAAIFFEDTEAPIKFAAADLKAALESNNLHVVDMKRTADIAASTAPVQIIVTTQRAFRGVPAVPSLHKEGYAVVKLATAGATRYWLIGNDEPGAMYAALDLADTVSIDKGLGKVVSKTLAKPSMAVRGIKFNVPLDDRNESYEDNKSSSAQHATVDVWDITFWQRFLDQMARNRLNTLSLWNRHPFPSMVEVPGYPLASVTGGVRRRTGYLGETKVDPDFNGGEPQYINALSIQQKIRHWQKVMKYARDRGVGVHVFTWNIETRGTGSMDFSDDPDDVDTKAYTFAAVKSLINTYPLLAGIGVTAGENFPDSASPEDREAWLWDTWGAAYNAALAEPQNSGRKLKFTHRYLQSAVDPIQNEFRKLTGYNDSKSSFGFSFKYAEAHMHSTVKPGYIKGKFDGIDPGKEVTLELRDDDIYALRWGDHAFAQALLKNAIERTDAPINGFLMGPDGYAWGREMIKRGVQPNTGPLFIDKRWFSFALWGGLGYNNSIGSNRFKRLFSAHFKNEPNVSTKELVHDALARVSRIIPMITRFYWGSLDLHWNPETSLGQRLDKDDVDPWEVTVYQGARYFADARWDPMAPGSQDEVGPWFQSIPEYVADGPVSDKLTPLDAAKSLEEDAKAGLDAVAPLVSTDAELEETIADIKAMAYLGYHYASKIRGAVALKSYEKTNQTDPQLRDEARLHLQAALDHWSNYASLYSSRYKSQGLGRLYTWADVNEIRKAVEADLALVGGITK